MNNRSFFIAGSGTEVGKTFVSRILCDAFAEKSNVTYMKPIQTGCIPTGDGMMSAPDADFVFQGSAIMISDYDDHVPYRFEPACSPHLAAKLENRVIKIEHILESYQKIAKQGFTTIVEGAGGLLVPLSEDLFMIDLIRRLSIPVLFVASSGLGTLNHTLLSMKVLKDYQIRVAGFIFNDPDGETPDFIYQDNLSMLKRYTGPIPFLEVAHGAMVNRRIHEFINSL